VHGLGADVLRRAARAAELPLAGLEPDEPGDGPAGDSRLRGAGAALVCPGHGAGYFGRPDGRPRDRHLANTVPLAGVPAVLRMAQPASPDHPPDAGVRSVPI